MPCMSSTAARKQASSSGGVDPTRHSRKRNDVTIRKNHRKLLVISDSITRAGGFEADPSPVPPAWRIKLGAAARPPLFTARMTNVLEMRLRWLAAVRTPRPDHEKHQQRANHRQVLERMRHVIHAVA